MLGLVNFNTICFTLSGCKSHVVQDLALSASVKVIACVVHKLIRTCDRVGLLTRSLVHKT